MSKLFIANIRGMHAIACEDHLVYVAEDYRHPTENSFETFVKWKPLTLELAVNAVTYQDGVRLECEACEEPFEATEQEKQRVMSLNPDKWVDYVAIQACRADHDASAPCGIHLEQAEAEAWRMSRSV